MVNKAYALAKERYAEIGVDTEKVLEQMQDFHLSLHCWQADDVKGFEVQAGAMSGGIQSTGDFPGAARNIDELRQDILKAKSLIPGSHRLNLHEIYGDFKGKVVDRDEVTVDYFQSWIDWAKDNDTKLDFNSSSFSHPKSGSLSLANPDEGIRQFWVEHTKRCRDIANAMGEAQNDPCIMNLWVHDGCKDVSVNHALYRRTLKKSLDEIFEKKQPMMKDCIEGKVFGIGLESFTVGSHDFYTAYAAQNDKTAHHRHRPLSSHRVGCRQGVCRAAFPQGTDAPRQPSCSLGLRPRDHHGRPHSGTLLRNRTCRRTRPRSLWS